MEYAICIVPAAPVRKEPGHRVEMVNQLLFGETMEVLEIKDEWLRVKTLADQYEGWLTYHLVSPIDEELVLSKNEPIASRLINSIQIDGRQMNVPMGSVLVGFNKETGNLWNTSYHFTGSYFNQGEPSDSRSIVNTAFEWLNAPYLWGGKTFLGVDCSGFAQTVFRVNGIQLLRDAYQQAEKGVEVKELGNAKEADLAFFHNEKGRITHVGILLGPDQIIHSSGRVRVDLIDKEGIIIAENGKRTHSLHSIRRMLS